MQHKKSNSSANGMPLMVGSVLLLLFGCGLLSPSNGLDAARTFVPNQVLNHTLIAMAIGILVYAILLLSESIKNQ